jgi:NADPH:quinone reductase-like Zn-dependent oxidoreductase
MKAAVCDRYGPPEVLRVCEVPRPSPRPDEVRIRILASAVTASDIFIRSARVTARLQIPFRLMMGLTRPRHPILGFVFSGIIDETGAKTTRFQPGDEVYGGTGFRLGAYAEYRCMIESDSRMHGCLALKPHNLSHQEATAAAYGGLLALQYVDKGRIQAGDDVLIYGASGTSGTLAVQLAKSLGARVTAVCSTRNIDFVRSLGADEVLDYTHVDAPPSGARYAFVLDSVGGLKSLEAQGRVQEGLGSGWTVRLHRRRQSRAELEASGAAQGTHRVRHGVTYRGCGLLARRHRRSPPSCRGRTQARWGRSHDRVAANAN